MKKMLIIALLIMSSCNFLAYSQEVNTVKTRSDEPRVFIPKNHDPNFLKSRKLPAKSFYQSKSNWQHIIDSTWGPGDSLSRKLLIFNTYAKKIHDEFDGFLSLNLNYDSLYNHYLDKINVSTSKGAFSAIMSHFAYDLKDAHTYAHDSAVVFMPLNPGIPVLLLGNFNTVEHFGAATTILPDSSTLILRVAPNHPLNIEPGDIILGYDGIPWKNLVRELLDAGLPLLGITGGCKSAETYHNLIGAGLNWHLFNSIDILKFSTGDTLHLSVLPLLNLNSPIMFNNEQLSIPNIPFPRILPPPFKSDTVATYGILENTNTGFIYLAMEWPTSKADEQFYEAVKALKNTDALIIDMRFNAGGWAEFDKAFEILFNEYHSTIDDAHRCNSNTYELCPVNQWQYYKIDGTQPDYYDRPITVLLGPSCVSMGDVTAQRLRYHPMVRFFGSSPDASLGDNGFIKNFPGWEIRYSFGDAFHTSEPGVYLNRREFPIDYPVWFNKEDVAKGKDPVVEKSLEWINNLVYAHSVTTDKWSYSPGNDTVIANANIENPNSHAVSAKLIFESLDGSVTDSADMVELISKGDVWQGKWKTSGPAENTYWISLLVRDLTNGTSFINKHATRITTVPLLVDSLPYTARSRSRYTFSPYLKNVATTQKITNISLNLASNDPWVTLIDPAQRACSDLLPGQILGIKAPFYVSYDSATFPGYFNLKFTISSDGWPFWVTDTTIKIPTVGIEDKELSQSAANLEQNYPNPFYPSTRISFRLPKQSFVTLKVFDLSGREVATIASEDLPAGIHERQWNATSLPNGIYFYRLQAGQYTATKKLVLLK